MTIKDYVLNKKIELKNIVAGLSVKPSLLIIQINDDAASSAYVKGKIKDCEEIGIVAKLLKLEKDITQEELFKIIDSYNKDSSIHGMIVQMPLPKQIDEEKVKAQISVLKDVDGFNINSKFKPCTPLGIIKYLESLNFEFSGKNAVVVGRSNIVGKPMSQLLLEKSCNVTTLHSRTSKEDMKFYLEHADLVVSAVGKKYVMEGYKFKENAILVDVGITRVDGKLYGDFAPNENVAVQTPVPGGIGLITRLTLLENLMEAYKNEF